FFVGLEGKEYGAHCDDPQRLRPILDRRALKASMVSASASSASLLSAIAAIGSSAEAARPLQFSAHSSRAPVFSLDSAAMVLTVASTHLRVSSNQSRMKLPSIAMAWPPFDANSWSTMRW